MTTGFFEPHRSRIEAIALADIVEIGGLIKRATGDQYHIVRMRGEIGQVEAYPSEVERLLRRPMQLMPAHAGSTLLRVEVDDDGAFIVRAPLIAWALCLDGEIRPVTPSGVEDGDATPKYGWFVETSLGIHSTADTGEENRFEDVDELVKAALRWKKREDVDRAERAKAADA